MPETASGSPSSASCSSPRGFPKATRRRASASGSGRTEIYDQVRAAVEAEGRIFLRELNDLYVSPRIAKALLSVDPSFADGEKAARAALRAQFPKPKDITTDEFVASLQDGLAPEGGMPGTVVILDEVQQYIGDDTDRSYIVQEIVRSVQQTLRRSSSLRGDGTDGTVRQHRGAATGYKAGSRSTSSFRTTTSRP